MKTRVYYSPEANMLVVHKSNKIKTKGELCLFSKPDSKHKVRMKIADVSLTLIGLL